MDILRVSTKQIDPKKAKTNMIRVESTLWSASWAPWPSLEQANPSLGVRLCGCPLQVQSKKLRALIGYEHRKT
nr:hypothetical protein Iba_chr11bCG4860 [Ipomoea batatas]